MDVDGLQELAAQRGLTIDDVTAAVWSLPRQATDGLTASDDDVLQRLGVAPKEGSNVPLLRGRLLLRQLERGCLTLQQAADLLKRDSPGVRQQLTGPDRMLLGFRGTDSNSWLIPAFQLELGLDSRPAWGWLLQELPSAEHTSPVALVEWLTRSCPHLDGRSRAQAIVDGTDMGAIIAEAATFGMPA